jgi:hypothetical protein
VIDGNFLLVEPAEDEAPHNIQNLFAVHRIQVSCPEYAYSLSCSRSNHRTNWCVKIIKDAATPDELDQSDSLDAVRVTADYPT